MIQNPGDGAVKMLVGNKSDAFRAQSEARGQPVTQEQGAKMAQDWGMHFFQTSGVTGEGVEDALTTLVT